VFLQSGALIAAVSAASRSAAAQQPAQQQDPGLFRPPDPLPPIATAAALQVPKVKFGNAEISRVVVGCNPFYGWSHFNATLDTVMKEWYTPDRVCEVLHQCNRYGIDTFNYLHIARAYTDFEQFRAEGGHMHLIVQGVGDPQFVIDALQPLAIYHHGEMTDRAFQAGKLDSVREYCKKLRQAGVMVGVGSHKPEVIARVQEEGWDVDFFAGCVYNRTRTPEEWSKVLNGNVPVSPGDVYLETDPPRMYAVLRQTSKPCFAFKILAAGRIETPQALDRAFQAAFAAIKPADCVFVGMFPRIKDQVRENAERVHRILARS
jgi:hypothetical protein